MAAVDWCNGLANKVLVGKAYGIIMALVYKDIQGYKQAHVQ